jgi:hypothetical protein
MLIQCMIDTYAIYSQPYFDTKTQSYRNIITINILPNGPFASLVTRVNFASLSPYKERDSSCGFAVISIKNKRELMPIDELPMLFSFLMTNGYTIDTSLTKMLHISDIQMKSSNNLISFILYNY